MNHICDFDFFENLFQSYSVWKKLVNIYWSDHRDKKDKEIRFSDEDNYEFEIFSILSIAYA